MGERPENVLCQRCRNECGHGPALDALVAERDRARIRAGEFAQNWKETERALAAERARADAAEAVVREYAARLAEEGAL